MEEVRLPRYCPDQATGWMTKEPTFDSKENRNIGLDLKCFIFIPGLGSSGLPIQWWPGALLQTITFSVRQSDSCIPILCLD